MLVYALVCTRLPLILRIVPWEIHIPVILAIRRPLLLAIYDGHSRDIPVILDLPS